MKSFRFLLILIITLLFFTSCKSPKLKEISLSGKWEVKLDSTNIGVRNNWAADKFSGIKINLPGTLDDVGIGKANTLKPAINNYVMSNLTRKYQYIGKAWYQKEISIPSSWKGEVITLSLERIIWESSVYIDGNLVGTENSLIGSHDYDLTKYITPGKHLLTICIDNSNKYPEINVAGPRYPIKENQDMAHAYTNHTQIKWNGILGEMVLKVCKQNNPTNLQVYPDFSANKLIVTFDLDTPLEDIVNCEIKSVNNEVVLNEKVKIGDISGKTISFEINRPEGLAYWDEFNPALYDMIITCKSGSVKTRFGYKDISYTKGDLTLNGNRIFLRGNLECVIFPLTGYPPMQKADWAKLIKQAKAYGLNHLRFHSWCPPKAAFDAADEAGLYCQVELPQWSLEVGHDAKTVDFLNNEADKIIRDYGNHPSFVLMTLGNELEGDPDVLNSMVTGLKAKDNRHLYATTSFSFQRPMGIRPEPEDEFFISQWTDKGWIRGQGIFNTKSPHFNADYSSESAHLEIPLISHEIGQYSVYPDMSEIEKYTGVLKPLNFIAVKNDLEKKGLLELAPDFTYNSGKLAALLYKEEIERALKTPSFDGFQLLQLQDFPGQGTALVGLLNAFWESKGVISAEEFSEFNSELVPLVRFDKAVYESGETFNASIEVANFFKPLKNQVINWTVSDENNKVLYTNTISNVNLLIGNNLDLGDISFKVDTYTAKKLKVEVTLENTKYKNSWHVWVYPNEVTTEKDGIVVTSSFEKASLALNEGKTVLLNPDYKTLEGIQGRFVPVFWSPVHFPNQPATMGLLVDDKHPAFNNFPTDTHTDWQWWDLCINSKSIITDALDVTPIVRVIDNFVTNHHLANVFEAKVGTGKLVFSSIDLMSNLKNRPVARQLRCSLLEYMSGESFNPEKLISFDDLKKIELSKKQDAFSTEDIYD
ncbi:sugar-binding domain-containing protein [Gaetbulibacter saemankumensis]|uniref:sugar-binding domain-containing protein n=1 Tax=Gaetbulibacter saemankumensis TaxID=311208 RepID=UPI000428BB3A|nr:sugar-binding domain-containing protein [Gaetbulibacter saemankumensis]